MDIYNLTRQRTMFSVGFVGSINYLKRKLGANGFCFSSAAVPAVFEQIQFFLSTLHGRPFLDSYFLKPSKGRSCQDGLGNLNSVVPVSVPVPCFNSVFGLLGRDSSNTSFFYKDTIDINFVK